MIIEHYSFVLFQLVGREIKRKYTRSKLGILWSVLNPLLSMAVISMVFSTMFKKSIEKFPLYYMTGSILWSMFTGATRSAMTAIVDNKQLLLKVKLPKQIFPLSRIFTSLVDMLYSLIAFAVLLIVFKSPLTITAICFPSILLLMLLFSIGIGYMLSVLYVFFADIKHLYSVFLTLLMYISALFYPVDGLNDFVYKVVTHNPIYWFIAAARDSVLYGQWIDSTQWIKMSAVSVIVFILGVTVFRLNEDKLMQEL